MINATFFSTTEYHREPIDEATRHDPFAMFKRALPVLAAWINPDTDTYWMRGQDTLTIGDQARWIQLKGALATTATLQAETAAVSNEAVKEYEEIVHRLSRPQMVQTHAASLVTESPTARQALRLGDNAAAIALLQEWLDDESGYDESVWPQVKAAIEENRLSYRTRFGE